MDIPTITNNNFHVLSLTFQIYSSIIKIETFTGGINTYEERTLHRL